MRLSVYPQGKKPVAKQVPAVGSSPAFALAGKTVFFHGQDGTKMAGVADRLSDDGSAVVVKLAVPNPDGVLLVSDGTATIPRADIEPFNGLTHQKRIRHFDAVADFRGEPTFKAIREKGAVTNGQAADDGRVVDYQDVTIQGLASTFEEDRDGETILPGAFDKSLARFKENPVMLTDHMNRCACVAGSYTKVGTTKEGLIVDGKITNAPDMAGLRFRIVEGHLKCFSIGGFFFYSDKDYRAVEEVELFEISLIPIPANEGARFQVRAISLPEAERAYKMLTSRHALKFATK